MKPIFELPKAAATISPSLARLVGAQTDIAMSSMFWVRVIAPNEVDLGSWQAVKGLEVKFAPMEYRTGESGNSTWYAAGAATYPVLQLTRALRRSDTEKVRSWMSNTPFFHEPGLMVVTLKDAAGIDVFSWELKGAMPLRWAVSAAEAGNNKMVMETLEVTHQGFLDDEVRD
jgi:phage tail-like protein